MHLSLYVAISLLQLNLHQVLLPYNLYTSIASQTTRRWSANEISGPIILIAISLSDDFSFNAPSMRYHVEWAFYAFKLIKTEVFLISIALFLFSFLFHFLCIFPLNFLSDFEI